MCRRWFPLKVDPESLAGPDPLAVSVEEKRHRTQAKRDEREQRVAPAEAKRFVHPAARERQNSAREGPEDRVGSDRGGGVDRVGVDKVGGHRHLREHQYWSRANERAEPTQRNIQRPATFRPPEKPSP